MVGNPGPQSISGSAFPKIVPKSCWRKCGVTKRYLCENLSFASYSIHSTSTALTSSLVDELRPLLVHDRKPGATEV